MIEKKTESTNKMKKWIQNNWSYILTLSVICLIISFGVFAFVNNSVGFVGICLSVVLGLGTGFYIVYLNTPE